MKYAALSNGAELAPSSATLGMLSGRGVVSMRTSWLNLEVDSDRVNIKRSSKMMDGIGSHKILYMETMSSST